MQQRGDGVRHPTDADIWVPYGAEKLAVGDSVYCVGIDAGELLLFGRVTVGRMDVDLNHRASLDVWAAPGGSAFRDDRVLSAAIVDGLRYLKADGTEQRFARNATGAISGSPFQGRSSIRQLWQGHEALDRAVAR
jgi:hypothetical protein